MKLIKAALLAGLLSAVSLLSQTALGQTGQQSVPNVPTRNSSGLQSQPRPQQPKKPKPLRTELSGGFRLTSDGWSLFADKGYVLSDEPKYSDLFYNVRLFQVEFGEHKSPKEQKRQPVDQTARGENASVYIFGKINNFYSLRLGYGFRRLIAGKPEPGTVSIHWTGVAGLALGLEKPYYLEAFVPQSPNTGTFSQKTIKYSDSTAPSFLNDQAIIGYAGWTKGLSEIKVVPGLHAKTALHFDFAKNARKGVNLMALEVGVSAELYTRKIALMAMQDNTPYLINMFASLQFGKRW